MSKAKKKVYFVVLHYQAIQETINCVNSIVKLSEDVLDVFVVIVDNASPNGSGKKLQDLYEQHSRISVILNQANLGFACGNNVGFKYAKQNNADYIVLINNDTVVKDCLFAQKIEEVYRNSHYGVLGPDILSVKDGIHQNPTSGFKLDIPTVKKKIMKYHLIRAINKVGLYCVIAKMKKRNKNYNNDYSKECVVGGNSNYVLHGSCMIFSKDYISQFDGLYSKTFMYFEENILAFLCNQHRIKMVYSPLLSIEHHRNISTNTSFSKQRDKVEFTYKWGINSLKELLMLMRNP
jgi:GT2 family glycosyltransferase